MVIPSPDRVPGRPPARDEEGEAYVKRLMAAVPPDATIKGMFINGLLDVIPAGVAKHPSSLPGHLTSRRIAWKDEPLLDMMEVAVGVARARSPGVPLRESLRDLGRVNYQTFLASLTGRVVLGVLGHNIHKLIPAVGKAYAVSQSHGRVRVVESTPTSCALEYTGLYQFLDTFELGVIEEACRACHVTPTIEAKLTSSSSGVVHVRF